MPPLAPLTLAANEREKLEAWVRRPKTAQRLALRSRIVLAAAAGQSNTAIAADLRVTLPAGWWAGVAATPARRPATRGGPSPARPSHGNRPAGRPPRPHRSTGSGRTGRWSGTGSAPPGRPARPGCGPRTASGRGAGRGRRPPRRPRTGPTTG